MIRNSTSTESTADMIEAGKHFGFEMETTVETDEPAVQDPSKPVEGEAEAVKPPAAETEAKPPSDLEPEEQAQESEAEKAKHKKLLKQVDKLTGRAKTAETALEAERARVAELERRLAAPGKQEPVAATPEPEPETPKRPVRPKQPRLDQFEYDQAKYDAALDKYEADILPAYEDELSKWTRAETMRDVQKAQAEEAEQRALDQESAAWTEVLDAHEGLREKLASATDVKVSGAMDSVLRTMMTPEARAVILEHFVDNPEVAEEMMHETTSPNKKPTADDWQYCSARASYLLARLESQLTAPQLTAPQLTAPPVKKPGPVAVPAKPDALKPDAPKPVSETPAPPAKPKPPVSAAPTPIEPVGAHPGSGVSGITDPKIATADYMKQREQQLLERRRARG